MKTYTIIQEQINKLSELINELMQLATTANTVKKAARVAIEAQTILFNCETPSPEHDNKCDECGEPVPLGALFWHNDELVGSFCKKCFRKLNKDTEIGYATLEKRSVKS